MQAIQQKCYFFLKFTNIYIYIYRCPFSSLYYALLLYIDNNNDAANSRKVNKSQKFRLYIYIYILWHLNSLYFTQLEHIKVTHI